MALALLLACASEPELPPLEQAARSLQQLDLLSATEAYRAGGDTATAARLTETYPELIEAQRALRSDNRRHTRLGLAEALLDVAGRGPEVPAARALSLAESTARGVYDHEPDDTSRALLVRALVRQDRWDDARALLASHAPVLEEGVEGLRLRIRVRDLERARRLAALLIEASPGDPERLWLAARLEERSEDFAASRRLVGLAAKAGSAPARARGKELARIHASTGLRELLRRANEAAGHPAEPEVMLLLDAIDTRMRENGQRLAASNLERLRQRMAKASADDADARFVMGQRRERAILAKRALDRRVDALTGVIDAASEAFERNETAALRQVIERCNRELRRLRTEYDRLAVRAAVLTPPLRIDGRSITSYRKQRDQLARARGLVRGARRRAPPAAIAPEAALGEARGRAILKARIQAEGTLRVVEVSSGADWIRVAVELPLDDVPATSYPDFAALYDADVRKQLAGHVAAARVHAFVPSLFQRYANLREVQVQLRSASGAQTSRIVIDRRGAAALARREEPPSVASLGALARECWYQVDDAVEPSRRPCAPAR